jgi:outer membrane protein OmpA-like peptidoglycan-associated protein
MKKIILLLSITISCLQLQAQEMLGIANSNYAGVSGMHLNPSTIVDSRLKIDFNLVTFGISFDNDYLYIPKSKLTFFGFKNIGNAISDKDDNGNKQYLEYDTTSNKNITFAATIKGPSVAFAVKNNYFAISTAVCSYTSIKDLHYAVAKFGYEEDGLHYKPQQGKWYESGPLNIGAMVWGELGVTYGREIYSKEKHYLKGAITLKRLWGYASVYCQGDNIRFRIDEDTVSSSTTTNSQSVFYQVGADVRYGHSFNENVKGTPYGDLINGDGWGVDLGFAYEYRPDFAAGTYSMDGKELSNPQVNKYKLRVGASLLDIGKIRFGGTNSKDFDLRGASSAWVGWDTINTFNTIDFDTTISNYFFGSPYASQVAASYNMALPTAVSLQVDYQAWKNIYVNSTWVQSIKRNIPGVRRANIISLTPRYERNWFEVSVPMSFYEYDVFRVGLSVRLASLIIGSDKLGSVLGISDMGGMDFYMALKFSITGSKVPDKDGDGVSNKRDACPDVPGLLAFDGCPDRDGDGIQDSQDDCPDVKGLVKFKGCPDRDGDDVEDRVDQCPDVAGLVEFNGCPDTDHDGIIDSLDACPRDSGLAIYKGCPDTDGDSIPDVEDECPLIAGPASNKGCPIIEKAPEPKAPVVIALTKEEEEIINKVFRNLEFETGKSVIRSSSFASLDELAELLKRKTTYKLNIDGHTDNVGGKTYNQKLSDSRANAVKKYLTDKGIDASRINAKGYGLTKPVASNKTPEGRQRNRRVEFTILE